MKITEKIMGTQAAIEVLDEATPQDMNSILEYFHTIEKIFDVFNKESQLSRINRGLMRMEDAFPVVRKVLKLCEQTRLDTHGYFDAKIENIIDPSGLLKGFAISQAVEMLKKKGCRNFYIEIGGNMEISGLKNNQLWRVGIVNPVKKSKPTVVAISDRGIATSGLNARGLPVYNPVTKKVANVLTSVTVIAENSLEADRFSTAAHAMGNKALDFLNKKDNVEALIIFRDGKEQMTTGFSTYM